MVLIEHCSVENVLEARKKERKYIEELNATLNKFIPSRTHQEYSKQWYIDNKEKIINKITEFRNTHKYIIAERKNKYRLANIEQIKMKQSKRCDCECGKSYTMSHKATHKQSKRHCMYLTSIETIKTNGNIV
jgi:hypothetical protein